MLPKVKLDLIKWNPQCIILNIYLQCPKSSENVCIKDSLTGNTINITVSQQHL